VAAFDASRPHNAAQMNQPALSAFLWSVADLLRGD
jgi:hypothetical protein